MTTTFEELYRQASGEFLETPVDRISRIHQRRNKLQEVAEYLKGEFVGLDSVIDEIIRNIENWYVMPELNTRPVIVSLWGMTGVGKTDLVRKLSQALGFRDKFVEVQLSSGQGSAEYYSIKSDLGYSNIETGKPGIVLFDEIQRWRSVSSNGGDTNNTKYQDIWTLLSDGKFEGKTSRLDLFGMVYGGLWSIPLEYKKGFVEEEEVDEDEVRDRKLCARRKENRIYHSNFDSARNFKMKFKLEEDVLDIMKWSEEEKRKIALNRINDQEVYEGDDYSKLLIFISGNLDEAYSMSGSVADADIDADVLYDFSTKINFLTIKTALRKRFRPEQISRFGNVHVIYPSMSRASYETLIEKKLSEFAERAEAEHGVRITFEDSIHKFVYRNGVIPSQGVRPVFSTISSYVENACPNILLAAIEAEIDEVTISYDESEIFSVIDGKKVAVETLGAVDEIKKDNKKDSLALVSAHEAGHALLYAMKFGVAPTQIISNTTSPFKDGYIGIHDSMMTRESVDDIIAVLMAGRAAEEYVFGRTKASTGAMADIRSATAYAARLTREWGFGKYNSLVREKGKEGSELTNTSEDVQVDINIDTQCKEGLEEAQKVIKDNNDLYMTIVNRLYKEQEISPKDFKEILAEHGVEIKIFDAKSVLCDNYSEMLENKLNAWR